MPTTTMPPCAGVRVLSRVSPAVIARAPRAPAEVVASGDSGRLQLARRFKDSLTDGDAGRDINHDIAFMDSNFHMIFTEILLT